MKKFMILLVVVIVVVIGFLFYEGVFYSVKLREQAVGGYWVVYQGNIGPYEKVEPVIAKVCKNLKNDGIETKSSFGLYYDNPRDMDKEKLKSEVGAILDEKYYDEIGKLKAKYNIKQLKKRNSLVAEFPIKNVLSYMIGPMKVYPAMEKYCKAKNIDCDNVKDSYGLEIYDMENKKITYIMPID